MMKKLMMACAALALCTGCLSVIRLAKLGKPTGDYTRKVWSEEKCAYVEETIHYIHGEDPLQQFGLMPTLGMRWDCLKMAWGWYPPNCSWAQRRLGLTCAVVLLTPGIVVDLPVDIISLPWDWKYRGGGETMYDREQKERALRSKCEFCGAISEEGRFGLCIMGPRLCEERKERLGTRHGCCPACAAKAKEAGYRFR